MNWWVFVLVLVALVALGLLCRHERRRRERGLSLWRELVAATGDDPARSAAADRLGAAESAVECRGGVWRLKRGAKAIPLEPAADLDAPIIGNEFLCPRRVDRAAKTARTPTE